MLTYRTLKEVITLKIAGYARISVDLQEDNQENTSIENQKRIIEDYVATYFPNAELHIYEDRDRSGYTFAQRENYQIMRRELMSSSVKILIIKDFPVFPVVTVWDCMSWKLCGTQGCASFPSVMALIIPPETNGCSFR